MKRVLMIASTVLATLTCLWLLWQFRGALGILLLSLFLAAAARPMMDQLSTLGLPEVTLLPLAYLVGIGLLIGSIVFVQDPLFEEAQNLTDELIVSYDQLILTWGAGNQVERAAASYFPEASALNRALFEVEATGALEEMAGFTSQIMGLFANLILALVLSVYWSHDRFHFERLWLSFLPGSRRTRAIGLWRDLEAEVGNYFYSELIQSFFAGWLLGIGYLVLGHSFPVLLALAGALLWFIPWLGGGLALVLVVLSSLNQPQTALLAGAYTLGVFLLLETKLEPRLFRRRSYSTLLRVVLMLFLFDAFGLAGILLAPPVGIVAQILFRYLLRFRRESLLQGADQQESDPQVFMERLQDLRARFQHATMEESLPDALVNLYGRLEKLGEKTTYILDEQRTGSGAEHV